MPAAPKSIVPSLLTLLRRLWHHIPARYRGQLAALLALTMLGAATDMISIGLVLPLLGVLTAPEKVFAHPVAQPFIAALGLESPQEMLLPITVVFCAAVLFTGALRLLLLWAQVRFSHALGAHIGARAYRQALYQPYLEHTRQNSSSVLALLTGKINMVVEYVVLPLLTLISSLVNIVLIVVFLATLDFGLTATVFVGLGAFYVATAVATDKRLRGTGQRLASTQNRRMQIAQENLGGIRDVILDRLQETCLLLYSRADKRMRRAQGNLQIIRMLPRQLIEALGITFVAGLAFWLTKDAGAINKALLVLGTLVLAIQRLLPLMQQVYNNWGGIQGGRAALAEVLHLLDTPVVDGGARPLPPLAFTRQITLRDVCFRYHPQGPWVLQGIDLEIPHGSRIGFVGATGCGKSTLLDVVMGLLAPTAGGLYIDDRPVDEGNSPAWQAHIAHVPQSIFLADTTIMENIAFGVPREKIDVERVREAAALAQIAATIDSWEQGYDTFVGERGIRLSGGQRQRIGIARALYKRAHVLIFDEATSALDGDTESAVMAGIDSLPEKQTVLIVSHRLTTLKNCDWIVALQAGRLQRVVRYEDLEGPAAVAASG